MPLLIMVAYLQLATSVCAIITAFTDPGILPPRKDKIKISPTKNRCSLSGENYMTPSANLWTSGHTLT